MLVSSFCGYAIHRITNEDGSRYYIIESDNFKGREFSTITCAEYAIICEMED